MKTSIWGPSAWRFLHAVTFAYPEHPTKEHKDAARNLFRSLKLLLPCGDCCDHYCKGMDSDPVEPHLESRDALSRWLVNFHNNVNARLGKASYPYENAKAEFDAEDEMCATQKGCDDSPPPRGSNYISLRIVLALLALFLVSLVLQRVF